MNGERWEETEHEGRNNARVYDHDMRIARKIDTNVRSQSRYRYNWTTRNLHLSPFSSLLFATSRSQHPDRVHLTSLYPTIRFHLSFSLPVSRHRVRFLSLWYLPHQLSLLFHSYHTWDFLCLQVRASDTFSGIYFAVGLMKWHEVWWTDFIYYIFLSLFFIYLAVNIVGSSSQRQ